jgi:hypothetical protein
MLITLLLACCFGSAMAQSSLAACGGDPSRWDQCYGTDRSYYREIRGFVGKYSGEWVRGMPSGQGVLILPNGQGYVEASEIPKHPGIARKFVSDGGRYIGYFKNGLYDGSGVQYSKSGAVEKSGIWKDGNLVQSKFVDVATFTRIPNLSNSASNLAQLRKTEEQAKQKQAELEAQRIATELALAQATKAAQEQVKLEAQLAAQQQLQIKPAAQIAPQGKRVALVIGNAKYKFSPLNNPVNDATDMAASLRSVGFDVIEVKDATLKQMREATRRFADKLE